MFGVDNVNKAAAALDELAAEAGYVYRPQRRETDQIIPFTQIENNRAYQRLVGNSAVICLDWRVWPLASSRWPGTTTTARIHCLTWSTPQRCPDPRRRCDSVPSACENGRNRPWCGLSCVHLAVRAGNRRQTADLQ